MITVALPKGRIAQDTLKIFEELFDREFIFDDRKLILETDKFRFLLVRSQDVPTYVYNRSADIGVVGLDVLEEKELDLVKLLDLGIGKCKVSIGVKKGDKIDYSKPEIKIATKMVNITKRHFAKRAIAVDIIKLYGSIELAPLVGLADAIVDIVETGATMKQNGLEVVEDIMDTSVYLIANKNSFYENKKDIIELYSKIKKVVDKD